MAGLLGISHIDLTVSDIDRSTAFYGDVLGFSEVHRSRYPTRSSITMMHNSGLALTVLHHDATPNEPFDETRVGLDHLSFHVADRSRLEEWVQRLDDHGVAHSGIIDAHFGATVVLRDPDNIQLELFVPPSAEVVAELTNSDPARAQV